MIESCGGGGKKSPIGERGDEGKRIRRANLSLKKGKNAWVVKQMLRRQRLLLCDAEIGGRYFKCPSQVHQKLLSLHTLFEFDNGTKKD